MNKHNYRIVFNGSISHSKGPWKSHKYLRKEGSGSSAKYYYSVKSNSGGNGGKKDPSTMSNIELAAYVKETANAENAAYDDVNSKYDAMISSGYQPDKTFALGEPIDTRNVRQKLTYSDDTRRKMNEYNESVSNFKSARDDATAARAEAARRAKKKVKS